jgi:hypothetical protein
MFGNVDGQVSSRGVAKSKDESEKEQKICEKFVQNWVRRFAKCFVQSE